MAGDRVYGGVSAEDRRAERRQRLLDAALDLVSEDGITDLTVRGVCGRAELSSRFFYESFTDLEHLVGALLDARIASAVATIATTIAQAPSDVESLTRVVITAAVDFATDPRHRRLVADWQSTETLRQRRTLLAKQLAAIMLATGRELLGESAEGIHAELTAQTVVNGELEVVAEWVRGELDVERDQLIDFLVAMALTASKIPVAVENYLKEGSRAAGTDQPS